MLLGRNQLLPDAQANAHTITTTATSTTTTTINNYSIIIIIIIITKILITIIITTTKTTTQITLRNPRDIITTVLPSYAHTHTHTHIHILFHTHTRTHTDTHTQGHQSPSSTVVLVFTGSWDGVCVRFAYQTWLDLMSNISIFSVAVICLGSLWLYHQRLQSAQLHRPKPTF